MPASNDSLYQAHVKNLRAVNAALDHTQRDLNRAIAEENSALAVTLQNLALFLAGAWAECRLKKLLYEPGGFSDADRVLIKAEKRQADRWRKALEVGYRKRYNVAKAALSDGTLPGTAWFRLQAIRQLITDDLEPLIGLRNTLAHGQWARPLNSEETDISGLLIKQIRQENALSIKFKLTLIGSLSNLIHDLVAAASFERDFDLHFRQTATARTNLLRRSYTGWQKSMVEKQKRGRGKRDAAIASVANAAK